MKRTIKNPRITIGSPARAWKLLLGLAALALLLGACGGDDEISAGDDTTQDAPDDSGTEDTDTPDDDDRDDDDGDTDDDGTDDDTGDDTDKGGDDGDGPTGSLDDSASLTVTESHPELISAQTAPISEVETIDDQTLAVRFSNGSEPCSLANVLVDETADSITVTLQTGLHPDAASMSCVALIVDYEIQVELADPVADREIIAVEP